jgi:hypothetical protein
MKQIEGRPLSDDVCALEFLKRHPNGSFSDVEISRHLASAARFVEAEHRVRSALSRLLALHMVETNGSKHYRLKIASTVTAKNSAKKLSNLKLNAF